MPAVVLTDPLRVEAVFSDGRTGCVRLDELPVALAEDLAAGLAARVHPHGTIDSTSSLLQHKWPARRFARFLAESGFSGGVDSITKAWLLRYFLSGDRYTDETAVRRVLLACPATAPELHEFLAGRVHRVLPKKQPLRPYSEREWSALMACCRSLVRESFRAHRAALADARSGADPATAGATMRNVRWLLAERGPMIRDAVALHSGIGAALFSKQFRRFLVMSEELFPSSTVLIAYRLLFGCFTGVVPDGIEELGLDDITWAGDTTVLLDYIKHRIGPESTTLSRPAVRLLTQWLEHSALLRAFAEPEQRSALWLRMARSSTRGRIATMEFRTFPLHRWAAEQGLLGDDGATLVIHKSRIRTTYLSQRDRRSWTGRATIDPNHTARVEADHYLTATTARQRDAIEAIIADAQSELVAKATAPTVLDHTTSTADLALLRPDLLDEAKLDDAALREVLAGERDVFTSACADQLAGLHGPKGKPCPARPWVCLLCPLAVFTPRHAGNLLRLKAFFARQWQQMTAAQFARIFGPFHIRLLDILDRYEPAVLGAAAAEVADGDDEIPLRPEETTRPSQESA